MGKKLIIYGADFSENAILPTVACATPVISINRNNALSALITLTTETAGAQIYYTTNGDTPTAASTLYSTIFQVASGLTVKAIAVKVGNLDSEIASSLIELATEHILLKVSQNTNTGDVYESPSGTRAASIDYFVNAKSIQTTFSNTSYVHAYDVNGVYLGIAGNSVGANVSWVDATPKSVQTIINTFNWYLAGDNTVNARANAAKIRVVFSSLTNVGKTIYSY